MKSISTLVSGVCLLFSVFFYNMLGFSTQVYADDKTDSGFVVNVGIGLEQLSYEERDPETGLDSNATTKNYTLSFEALKFWPSFFLRIDSIIPLLAEDGEERWDKYGQLYQTNELKYKWSRVDGCAGYSSKPYLQPFLGLRWSYVTQNRNRFVVQGNPRTSTAEETIQSWHIGAGCMGDLQFHSKWKFSYVLTYFLPFSTEVKNDSVPGWEASDIDGYTAEVRAGIGYCFKEHVTVTLIGYGGIMHWDGSGWEPFDRGRAKWPENDTEYMGGIMDIGWKF